MVALGSYYTATLDKIRRLYLVQRVSADDLVVGWQTYAAPNFDQIFGTEYGRWWWQKYRWAEPEIIEFGDRYLNNLPNLDCGAFVEEYLSSTKGKGERD